MKYDPALFGDFSGSASLRTASIFSSMLSGCQDLLRRFAGAVLARIVSRADHSADRGIIQLLKALLQKDPSKRPSARKSFKALYTTASQSLSLSMSAEMCRGADQSCERFECIVDSPTESKPDSEHVNSQAAAKNLKSNEALSPG